MAPYSHGIDVNATHLHSKRSEVILMLQTFCLVLYFHQSFFHFHLSKDCLNFDKNTIKLYEVNAFTKQKKLDLCKGCHKIIFHDPKTNKQTTHLS